MQNCTYELSQPWDCCSCSCDVYSLHECWQHLWLFTGTVWWEGGGARPVWTRRVDRCIWSTRKVNLSVVPVRNWIARHRHLRVCVCVCVFVNLAARQHLAPFFLFKTCIYKYIYIRPICVCVYIYIYIYMYIHTIIQPMIKLYDRQTVQIFESKFAGEAARQFLYHLKLWCK
jgi:hypothetical protein